MVHLFADGSYAGEKLRYAMQKTYGPVIEIVERPDRATGFVVIARRYVAERTLACFGRCHFPAKDQEARLAFSEAWLLIASIRRAVRFIARA